MVAGRLDSHHARSLPDEVPVSDFRARTSAFLAEFFPLFPTAATGIGEHAYDDRWPDMSAAGREARLAFADRWLAEFRAFENLSADDTVDRDLLVQQLEAMRFSDLDLREEAWNPLDWVYLLGGGLFPLIAREFAPLADRLDRAFDVIGTTGCVSWSGRAARPIQYKHLAGRVESPRRNACAGQPVHSRKHTASVVRDDWYGWQR